MIRDLFRSVTLSACVASAMMASSALATEIEPTPELPTTLSLSLAGPPVAAPGAPGAPAPGVEVPPPAPAAPAYRGGRGLISASGMSGMFLNPTSGTLDQGQFTVQFCSLKFANDGPDIVGYGVLTSYGVTDWLEVGGFFLWADVAPIDKTFFTAGPQARVRILKDEGWIPETSVGIIYLDGNRNGDVNAKTEINLTFSKLFPIDPDGFFKSFRVHTGLRQVWRHENPVGTNRNATFVFVGGELELPYDLYFVAEISSKDDVAGGRVEHVPFGVGVQWKPNNIVGISIGGVRVSGEASLALYAGIGLVIKF